MKPTDFSATVGKGVSKDLGSFWRSGDRIVNEIDRADARPLAELLEPRQPGYAVQAVTAALKRFGPVEFFFGVDRDDKPLAAARAEAHQFG